MKETKSELKVLVGFMIILAGYLFGLDIQQIILLLTDAEQYVRDIRELVQESSGKDGAAMVGGAATIFYGAFRTYLKTRG